MTLAYIRTHRDKSQSDFLMYAEAWKFFAYVATLAIGVSLHASSVSWHLHTGGPPG